MHIGPLVLFVFVMVLVVVRRNLRVELPLWVLMIGGSLLMVALRFVSLVEAVRSVNFDLVGFLLGLFIVLRALEASGDLDKIVKLLFYRVKNGQGALLRVVFGLGIASSIFLNDVVVTVGAVALLSQWRGNERLTRVLLLALMFAVTVGGLATPLGSPQSILIALSGVMDRPFVAFVSRLAIPTLLALGAVYGVFSWRYHRVLMGSIQFGGHSSKAENSNARRWPARVAAISFVVGLGIVIGASWLGQVWPHSWALMSLICGGFAIVFAPQRVSLIRRIDWELLLLFVGLFVLAQGVWLSGVIQELLASMSVDMGSAAMVVPLTLVLSQFISNLPVVVLFLPLLEHVGASMVDYFALVVSSGLAGCLWPFAAASNLIVFQLAERGKIKGLSVGEFVAMGSVVLILSGFIFWGYFFVVGW